LQSRLEKPSQNARFRISEHHDEKYSIIEILLTFRFRKENDDSHGFSVKNSWVFTGKALLFCNKVQVKSTVGLTRFSRTSNCKLHARVSCRDFCTEREIVVGTGQS
jgi:hypothetical protein